MRLITLIIAALTEDTVRCCRGLWPAIRTLTSSRVGALHRAMLDRKAIRNAFRATKSHGTRVFFGLLPGPETVHNLI